MGQSVNKPYWERKYSQVEPPNIDKCDKFLEKRSPEKFTRLQLTLTLIGVLFTYFCTSAK